MPKNRLATNLLIHGLSSLIGIFILVVLITIFQHKNESVRQSFDAYAATGTVSTDPNMKMAFMGDQGLGANAEEVLKLIQQEGALGVVHAGDVYY